LTRAAVARALVGVALGIGAALHARVSIAAFAQVEAAPAEDAAAFLARVEHAWNVRDAAAYLALWEFA
jgi:hypothetical protein